MSDLEMSWSGDLSLTPTGDLLLVSEPSLGTQRILRRLLTNPKDYIWNPDYGAGLARFVGKPADLAGVEALIRAQMALEQAVAATQEPVVTASTDVTGRLYVQIRYEDSLTSTVSSISTSL